MIGRELAAMGTTWWIACDLPALLDGAEARVHELEACLSRFRPGSALRRLVERREVVDPVLAAVTAAALALRASTGGAFDPTLGARLGELGYDRPFDPRAPRVAARAPAYARPALEVSVQGDRVRLRGDGALDLGGVAKGWAVDDVLERLRRGGAGWALVDGGGDLRGFGRAWPIGVGEDLAVEVEDEAVATSSTLARRWRTDAGDALHHVLDPGTGAPARSVIDTATVIAPTAALADGLATALLVDPASLLPRLAELRARAAVRDGRGRWWTTPGWEGAR